MGYSVRMIDLHGHVHVHVLYFVGSSALCGKKKSSLFKKCGMELSWLGIPSWISRPPSTQKSARVADSPMAAASHFDFQNMTPIPPPLKFRPLRPLRATQRLAPLPAGKMNAAQLHAMPMGITPSTTPSDCEMIMLCKPAPLADPRQKHASIRQFNDPSQKHECAICANARPEQQMVRPCGMCDNDIKCCRTCLRIHVTMVTKGTPYGITPSITCPLCPALAGQPRRLVTFKSLKAVLLYNDIKIVKRRAESALTFFCGGCHEQRNLGVKHDPEALKWLRMQHEQNLREEEQEKAEAEAAAKAAAETEAQGAAKAQEDETREEQATSGMEEGGGAPSARVEGCGLCEDETHPTESSPHEADARVTNGPVAEALLAPPAPLGHCRHFAAPGVCSSCRLFGNDIAPPAFVPITSRYAPDVAFCGPNATPGEWLALRNLFDRAVDAGISSLDAIRIMVKNVQERRFSPNHYFMMWTERLGALPKVGNGMRRHSQPLPPVKPAPTRWQGAALTAIEQLRAGEIDASAAVTIVLHAMQPRPKASLQGLVYERVLPAVADPLKRATLTHAFLRELAEFRTPCCKLTHCFNCHKRGGHPGMTCARYQARNAPREAGIVSCPKCSVPLIKTEGCNAVVCPCGHGFNYALRLREIESDERAE